MGKNTEWSKISEREVSCFTVFAHDITSIDMSCGGLKFCLFDPFTLLIVVFLCLEILVNFYNWKLVVFKKKEQNY